MADAGVRESGHRVTTVAALYVDPNGVYADAPDVELWDEQRDARLYAGPHPVVAHPPCARWCMLAPLNAHQYGYQVGDDDGCFASALLAVETYGGVLEHHAYSYAWPAFHLPRPWRGHWIRSFTSPGWVVEISQAAYGHPTRKRTWLYYVGQDPPDLDWSEPKTTAIVSDLGSGGSRRRGADWIPGVQYAAASSTPVAFRDALLDMARNVGPVAALPAPLQEVGARSNEC